MIRVNNIETIRIPLNENNIYYFPKNSNLIGKKIDNIYAIAGNIADPVNSLTTMTARAIYITLVDHSGNTILDNIDIDSFEKHNITLCNISSKIDWDKSYINIQYPTTREGKELILFVTFDGVYAEKTEYNYIKTLKIPANYKGDLEQYITSDCWGKLVKMDILNSSNVWISLYDKNGKNFDLCNALLFKNQMVVDGGRTTTRAINNPIYFNYLDVNWQESLIVNGTTEIEIILYFAK